MQIKTVSNISIDKVYQVFGYHETINEAKDDDEIDHNEEDDEWKSDTEEDIKMPFDKDGNQVGIRLEKQKEIKKPERTNIK